MAAPSLPSVAPSSVLTADTRAALLAAEAFCFDVDSTLITGECIELLAEENGKLQAVKDLTDRAMGGTILFQDALRDRLELIAPTREQISRHSAPGAAARLGLKFSPGVEKLIALLQKRGTKVFLVSGGFRSMIQPLADALGLPEGHVVANRILFDEDGSYKGFDPEEPTSRSQGKIAAVRGLKQRFSVSKVAMVGDGATDLEAKPELTAFVYYGGNVVREHVREHSDWSITDFSLLEAVFNENAQGE